MGKIKFKKGITLIEVIVSMLLLFTLVVSFTFVVPKLSFNVNKNKDLLAENLFIENSYKLFSSDPLSFKKNINHVYNISLIDNEITPTMFEKIDMCFYEDNSVIGIKIFYNNEEFEQWERKKVTQ